MGKVPKLRFEGFTGEWEEKKLGELSDFITKGATPTTYGFDWVEQGIPFFRNDSLKDNRFVFGDYSYISEEANQMISRSEIQEDDILVAITGDIGKVGIVPEVIKKGNINQHMARVRIVRDAHPYFVYQLLSTNEHQNNYHRIKTGLSMPQLSLEQIRATVLYLPLYKEQKKVGVLLKNLDYVFTLHQRKLDALQEAKKFYLQNLFPRKGEKKPRLRFEGFSGEWEEKRMNEFVIYSSSALSAKDAKDNGIYDLYDANHVIGKTNNTPFNTDYISIIKDGAGIGRIRKLSKNTMIIGTMGAIQAHYSDINFVFALMSGEDFAKNASGSTIPHIYFKDYGKKQYFIPTIVEQQILGQFFIDLDNLITTQQRKLETLKRLKQFMLQNLFV